MNHQKLHSVRSNIPRPAPWSHRAQWLRPVGRATPSASSRADFTLRFPRVVEAVRSLKVKSVLLDGEGIVYGHSGLPDFDLIHSKQYDRDVSLVAFDLLELNGDEMRKLRLVDRKARLAKLIAKVRDGIEFSEHIEGNGADIFKAACSGKTCPMSPAGRSGG